jgi:response regulator RpfG family c-di-GMP phosphodiesterase
VRPENDRLPIAILTSMGDAEDGQEKLEERVAAIEYIVRDISRGRVQIPVRAQ